MFQLKGAEMGKGKKKRGRGASNGSDAKLNMLLHISQNVEMNMSRATFPVTSAQLNASN